MTAVDPMVRMSAIVDDGILEAAYTWLCKRRRDYPSGQIAGGFGAIGPLKRPVCRPNFWLGPTVSGCYHESRDVMARRLICGPFVMPWCSKPWRSSWPTNSRHRRAAITSPVMAARRLQAGLGNKVDRLCSGDVSGSREGIVGALLRRSSVRHLLNATLAVAPSMSWPFSLDC